MVLARRKLLLCAVLCLMALPLGLRADPLGTISTVAGGGAGDRGLAVAACINPAALTLDAAGSLIVADPGNNRVRKVDRATGTITTVAGNGSQGFSGDGGPATAASLCKPAGVSLSATGDLFIADTGNNRVRRVDAKTGVISTVAGDGAEGFFSDGVPAVETGLNRPTDIALDAGGNLFIADAYNHRIRRVDAATGIITTVAGIGSQGFAGDGGPAMAASLALPTGIVLDPAGNLFIADYANARVRRVDMATGIIVTVAGSDNWGYSGDGISATKASLVFPTRIALDSSRNLYVADEGDNRVRKIDALTGLISTFAGTGLRDFSGDGGPAANAGLYGPLGVAIDSSGNAYISDARNRRIRKVAAATGAITTCVGNGSATYCGDGSPAVEARLAFPSGAVVDRSGNLYLSDTQNARVRKVDARTGLIATVAGTGISESSGDGGPGTQAGLVQPMGLAIDTAGNLLIADAWGNRIRRVDAVSGIITTFAGDGQPGFAGDGGPAAVASLNCPQRIALDSAGNLFIADLFNARIRKVDARTGIITTVAGNGDSFYSGDGAPALSAGFDPMGIALDAGGNLFIADGMNNRVRRVDAATGVITTVAGNGYPCFDGDGGPATSADLWSPWDLRIDASGNLLIADYSNSRIRIVDARTGIIAPLAGIGVPDYSGDGGPATLAGLDPTGLALDPQGNLLVTDGANGRVRKIVLTLAPPPSLPRVVTKLAAGLNLLSVPLIPKTGSWRDFFGSVVPKRILAWDTTLGRYVNASGPVSGKGYWIEMAAPATVAMEGQPADAPFALELSRGTNLLGNPFSRSVTWNVDKILVKLPTGATKTLRQACASGWVLSMGLAWDVSGHRLQVLADTRGFRCPGITGTIQTSAAFYVEAFRKCQLILPAE